MVPHKNMNEQQGPSAKVIADSINEWGQRLVTLECKFHRFILAEINTHRVFSRNSASNRAIPYQKQDPDADQTNTIRHRVMTDPAMPIHWGKEQKGMQSGEAHIIKDIYFLKSKWIDARNYAVEVADVLHAMHLHKSLINRLLEPFMWHTAIITSTEWANFFNQRCDPAAQPEMKAIADQMQIAYFSSVPKQLGHGEWHLPYIQTQDWEIAYEIRPDLTVLGIVGLLKQVSTARCARVSYLTHDGKRDLNEDINLFERLKGSGHWSPFEHQATPVAQEHDNFHCGNFVGWKQFRKEFSNENRIKFVSNLAELAQARMRIEAGLPR